MAVVDGFFNGNARCELDDIEKRIISFKNQAKQELDILKKNIKILKDKIICEKDKIARKEYDSEYRNLRTFARDLRDYYRRQYHQLKTTLEASRECHVYGNMLAIQFHTGWTEQRNKCKKDFFIAQDSYVRYKNHPIGKQFLERYAARMDNERSEVQKIDRVLVILNALKAATDKPTFQASNLNIPDNYEPVNYLSCP